MPYFDHNATTPLSAIARETWLKANDEQWQNPSSLYREAAKARIRMDNARQAVAGVLETNEDRVVFNSGATEGAHAVIAYLASLSPADAFVVVNRTEHPAFLEAARRWFGRRIRWLNTDREGVVDLAQLATIGVGAAAVIVMAANNETGVIQPWRQVAALCRELRVPFVCDASQWLGKLPAAGLGALDWVIGTGHKFGAPKGVGFVKIAGDAHGFSSQPGGSQENGHRGGTEDLPSIWAMAEALTEAERSKVLWESERLNWRTAFEAEIVRMVPGVTVVAASAERLWNTVALVLPFGENQRWVTKLDKKGFQLSTGSACAAGKAGPSHVLTAMGYSGEVAQRGIRISAGWETTQEDWRGLTRALGDLAAEWRAQESPVIKV